MSINLPRPAPPKSAVPAGDMGLGLCIACLGAVVLGQAAIPEFGITLAPILWPPGRPVGVAAVPCCWVHLQEQIAASSQKPLLVAR